jgi:hypothetical protein
MKKLKLFLVGVVLLATLPLAGLMAQSVINPAPSGDECWNAGQGPGGPSQWLCINQVRNGTAAITTSGAGAATTTVTNEIGTVIWTGAAPTTWALTLPCTPRPGAKVAIGSNTTLTTMVTVTAASGCTMQAAFSAQTVTANTSHEWQLIGTVWHKLR